MLQITCYYPRISTGINDQISQYELKQLVMIITGKTVQW